MATVGDLFTVLGGRLSASQTIADASRCPLGRVVSDSRDISPGDVFWALRGPNHDGQSFLAEAFARGATGAVVAKDVVLPANKWIIRVANTYQALLHWARWRRQQCRGSVVAVTGSAGKTTTREMIRTVLGSRLRGTASPHNFNNRYGLPLSMTAIEPTDDFAVLELGANAFGEIDQLADLCRPDIGVITCIGEAHLAGFGNRQGVARAKAELLRWLPANGHAVLVDDPLLHQFSPTCPAPVHWFGSSHCHLSVHDTASELGRLSFSIDGCRFCLPVWGRHHLDSALAAISVAQIFGFALDEIAGELYKFRAIPMRCDVQQVRDAWLIDDAYNANPTAMQAAFTLLGDFPARGRRIAVCGDMGELGDNAAQRHYAVGQQAVEQARVTTLIACGEYAREVIRGAVDAGLPRQAAIACRSANEATPVVEANIAPGDVVLIKGSRMMRMEQITNGLQRRPRQQAA